MAFGKPGRPPSEKTLVDRQLGRDRPIVLLPDNVQIPNHSGILANKDAKEKLDARYVNVDGDTMTGDLTLGTGVNQVKLNFSDYFASVSATPNKINLLSDAYGFGVSAGALNYTIPSGAISGHKFYEGTTSSFTFSILNGHDAHSNKIHNVVDPTSAQDVATKNYVDSRTFTLDGLSDVTIASVQTGDIIYKSAGDWKNLARPSGFGNYKLRNTSAGAISWVSDVNVTYTWNDVLSEGSTTSGVSPTISTNDKLYFRDTAIYVQSPTDSNLEVVADGDIKLNGATLTLTNSKNWKIGSLSAVASSVTGTTTETALATITIPANTLGANGQLRLYWVGSHTNSANTKTWRVRFNGITGTAIMTSSLTTTATVVDLRIIANRNATNSQVYWPGSSALINAGTSTVGTMAVDTTSAVDLVITAQLTNTGETMTLQNYCLEYTKGVSGWE